MISTHFKAFANNLARCFDFNIICALLTYWSSCNAYNVLSATKKARAQSDPTRLILFVLVGYPSGQRGQTVNLLALPSMVRIHHLPPSLPANG